MNIRKHDEKAKGKNFMKNFGLIVIVLFFLISCFSPKILTKVTNKYEPYDGIVAILYQKPIVDFEIIGEVVVREDGATLTKLFEMLQQKTAEMGGNAVIVQKNQSFSSDPASTVPEGEEPTLSSNEIDGVVGTAIFLKE